MINTAETTAHRLLLETLWQTGGRVQEVLRLRPCDLVEAEGAIALTNLKQRRHEQRRKLVYVNPDLLGALRALARDARVPSTGYFFRSRQSHGQPMSYEQCWRLIRRYALAAVRSGSRTGPRAHEHDCRERRVRCTRANRGVAIALVRRRARHS